MLGQYRHTLDAKGRLFVPAKLREELGSPFYIAKSPNGPYLTAYPEAEWQRFLADVKALPGSKVGALRVFFANVLPCEPDKQGRFLLPDTFRKYAGITQDVIFLGVATRAEIWAAERYEAMEAEEMCHPETLAAIMEEYGL